MNWGDALTPRNAWVAGWGRIEGGYYPDELLTARVPVYPPSACRSIGGTPFGTFCAGTRTGEGACSGDSGGPLARFDRFFELLGIVSHGDSRCRGFGVYTLVGRYRTWIAQMVRGYDVARVSLPEVRSVQYQNLGGGWIRARVRWCQRGVRGHSIQVEFTLSHPRRSASHTHKYALRNRWQCTIATSEYRPPARMRNNTWFLSARVIDNDNSLIGTTEIAAAARL